MNLPRRQKQLYDLLLGRGDVAIDTLYSAIAERDLETTQAKQQWLGPYIVRLNRRIGGEGLRVEPGALKNTYRLVAV